MGLDRTRMDSAPGVTVTGGVPWTNTCMDVKGKSLLWELVIGGCLERIMVGAVHGGTDVRLNVCLVGVYVCNMQSDR